MATKWYYESNGTQCGPITGRQMRELVAAGVITRKTRIRRADRNVWICAAQLQGLFDENRKPGKPHTVVKNSEGEREWYLRDSAGKTIGPVTKTQLDHWYQDNRINAACLIRHKNWAEWRSASDVYPSLTETTSDWEKVRRSCARIRDFIRDYGRKYFGGRAIEWPAELPHLRRCIAAWHHQFSAPTACNECGQITVGLRTDRVINGEDLGLQRVYEMCATSRRTASRLFKWSAIGTTIIAVILVLTTWWFLVLLPFAVVIGLAIPIVGVRYLNARIRRAAMRAEAASRQEFTRHQIDELNKDLIEPFLRRNDVPAASDPGQRAFAVRRLKSLDQVTDVHVDSRELALFTEILAKQKIILWRDPSSAQLVLNAFALRSDYALFRQRIEQLELAGMSVLTAYASLVDRDEVFLPFLQQLLLDRGIPDSASSLSTQLRAVRHELTLQGFARDLQQRRHGSFDITIEMVDAMDPYNFELLLGMMYEAQGYRILETPKSGDQGADVFIEKAGERTVIQAKVYAQPVGNKAVQEVIAARGHFRCHAAKVITNNYFTPAARELAKTNDVELIGRDELCKMIEEFNRQPKDYARLALLMQTPASGSSASTELQTNVPTTESPKRTS